MVDVRRNYYDSHQLRGWSSVALSACLVMLPFAVVGAAVWGTGLSVPALFGADGENARQTLHDAETGAFQFLFYPLAIGVIGVVGLVAFGALMRFWASRWPDVKGH